MTKTEIKQHLHTVIDSVEDESKLEEIQEIVDYLVNDEVIEWESLSEAERASIERGLKQLDAGEKIDFEDIKKKYPEWLKK